MARRGLDQTSGSRPAPPAGLPEVTRRVTLGPTANDNRAPLTYRLMEAAKWATLLAVIAGAAAWWWR